MSDQAKVFMPEFRTEGFGAAILSSRLSGVGKSVGFLYFEERTDPRIKRLSQVLQRNNLQVIREGTLGTGHAVFLPPGLHLGRRQWAALGVPEFRLQTQQFYHDLSSPASLKQLQDRAFADLGVKPENVAARRIASNRYMQDVFDGILGRAIVQNGTWHAEWEPGKDGRRKGEARPDSFMRGITAESFSGSARGIAMMIANGEKFDNPRMNLLYSAIIASAPHLSDTPGFRRLDLNEEVEGQLATLITPVGRRADNIHDFNISLDSNLAAHQERNGTRLKLQQFSTPFPIARSAFDVLLPQDGDRLLEPTIGNGTLVSSFLGRNIDITGVELDPARAGRSGRLLESATVIEGDFVKEAASLGLGLDFDMFVANPPFENLETNQLVHDRLGSRMTLRRLDHQIAYEGLQRLKPEGRAFLVLPGDMITNGALDGARRFWDNYLRQTYHVAGSACVDGRLYRKMGAEFPVLLYALGPMRDVPLSTEELRDLEVEALPLLVTHDELLSWADVTRERMIELTGLPSTEPGYTDQGRVQREPAAAVASRPSSPPVASLPKHGNDASDGAVASEYPGTPSKTAGKPRSQTAQPAGSAVEPNEIPEAVADPAPIPPDGQEPTASGIPATAITLVDDTEDDVFVRSYEPFSNCGEAQTKIQKSLQGLTYRALIDVEAKHGDVDDFVASKLNIPVSEPGNFVQFDTTLFPAMKDSRIALEMARVLDKEIRFVPGLITRVQFRPTDPLNLSAWKLDVASPGQTHVDTVGLTGAFGVLADMTSEERKEAFPGHETPRYAFTVSAIGVYGEFLDSKPEYASQHLTPYIYGDRHAANIADIKIPRYLENPIQYLSTRNEGFRDFIRHAFDDAPAGQVKRERYALDGNMFQAVKISQGKQRLGEKAIYTTSSGEVRHGVILKNENVSKLIGKLESNVAALSVPLDKTHPELIQSFIDVYRRISTLNDLGYAYSNYGQIDSRAREYLVNDLATLFSDGLDTPGVYDYADKHLLSIVNDMRKAMSSKAVSEVYVGSDVFIEAGTDISKTQTIERECFQDTHKKWVEVKTGFSPLGLATHAKGIGGDDLHLVFAGSTSVLLFHKKSELVAKAGGDMELLDRGTNKIDKAKLTKGVLATSSFRTEDVARLLHVVAKESSSNIMVRGPIAGVQGALTLHHAKAHEFAVDLALKNGNRRLEM